MKCTIDGQPAGLTPLTVSLAPASYSIQVGSGAERRDLAVNVIAGSSVCNISSCRLRDAEPVADRGRLLVQTEPSGQSVTVDGIERGQTPMTVSDLSAGDHSVVVRGTGRHGPPHRHDQGRATRCPW